MAFDLHGLESGGYTTARLYGELVDQFRGPILVIAGGPSVPRDLAELTTWGFAPVAVISANEHGHRQKLFEVTHTVSADGVHNEKRRRMADVVAELGSRAPLICPAPFADVRLPDWRCAANTGLISIAIALGMGGSPVVVTGIDFYRWKHKGAATYFHDPDARSNSNVKEPRNFLNQIQALFGRIGSGQPVRPMSGALLEYFPRWSPDELTPPATIYEYARFCRRMPTHLVRSHGVRWPLAGIQVPRGLVVPCSPLEARAACNARQAQLLEILPAPDLQTSALPA